MDTTFLNNELTKSINVIRNIKSLRLILYYQPFYHINVYRRFCFFTYRSDPFTNDPLAVECFNISLMDHEYERATF